MWVCVQPACLVPVMQWCCLWLPADAPLCAQEILLVVAGIAVWVAVHVCCGYALLTCHWHVHVHVACILCPHLLSSRTTSLTASLRQPSWCVAWPPAGSKTCPAHSARALSAMACTATAPRCRRCCHHGMPACAAAAAAAAADTASSKHLSCISSGS